MNQHARDGLLTIVLTSYNYAHFIREAVQSVVDQTCPEWRLVIFDNRSTDNTMEVLKPFLQDPRISLVVRDENIGARNNHIGARNNHILALRSVNTEFVATLQADDFLDKTFVEMAMRQFHQHPSAPFVFFNWHHFLDNSKQINYHNRHPFSPNRSGPLRIGPFLTVCNFVPFHMAVFRTHCLMSVFDWVIDSPLTQLGEQFVLKMIEDAYGYGCYSGTLGGYWRRHGRQLTIQHIDSSVADIEEPMERHWYVTKAPNPDYVNAFLALVTFVRYCSRISYRAAVDWLVDKGGARYAESVGIPITQERDRLQSIALTVALKYTTYTLILNIQPIP